MPGRMPSSRVGVRSSFFPSQWNTKTLAHDDRLRGDGFGGDFSRVRLAAGGTCARVLASAAGSVGGSLCGPKQRVGGSSPSSGAFQPSAPQSLSDAQFSPSAGDGLVTVRVPFRGSGRPTPGRASRPRRRAHPHAPARIPRSGRDRDHRCTGRRKMIADSDRLSGPLDSCFPVLEPRHAV